MIFQRQRLSPVDAGALRALGARNGWLVETTDTLRCGFGEAVVTVDLAGGLDRDTDVRAALTEHELVGVEGPPGTGITAFGTLPFDRDAASRLTVPRYVLTQTRSGDAWLTSPTSPTSPSWHELLAGAAPPTQETQSLRSLTFQPTPEEYAHRVALAVEVLRRQEIDKVVLARAVLGSVAESIDAAAVAERLRLREPICTIYSLPTNDGRRFVGASPELLVRRVGSALHCHPLAGTIALPPNVAPDDYETWLLGSTKNLHEHAVVVNDIVRLLAQRCDDIHVDPSPSIVALRTVAHLGTWIKGHCRELDEAPDAMEILRLLHPTAAVGGIPRDRAYSWISQLEQYDRGHYAGPLGWIDAEGDGEWWVGIRGVIIDGAEFEAWAGAGIVSESDPIAEREETKDKLTSVLSTVLFERV